MVAGPAGKAAPAPGAVMAEAWPKTNVRVRKI